MMMQLVYLENPEQSFLPNAGFERYENASMDNTTATEYDAETCHCSEVDLVTPRKSEK